MARSVETGVAWANRPKVMRKTRRETRRMENIVGDGERLESDVKNEMKSGRTL